MATLQEIKAMHPLDQWLFNFRVATENGGERIANRSDIQHHPRHGYFVRVERDEGSYDHGIALVPLEFKDFCDGMYHALYDYYEPKD